MALKNDRYTYRVTWSEEDHEHVGLCAELPSLSWLASTPEAAWTITALCEWQRDDDGISHLNYGNGPTPAVANFAREIMAHLSVSWAWQDEPWKLS